MERSVYLKAEAMKIHVTKTVMSPKRGGIEIELIKLVGGVRLLRFTEPKSGLALERKLDPNRPVNDQKKALAKVFQAALTQAELIHA
jgi:hypothetical protein